MVLKIEDLVKEYKRGNKVFNAVSNISLEVEEGDFINIIGRSGSGKSTLLNMISGLLTPTSGNILIDDEDICKKSDRDMSEFRNRKIGFVPQGADLIHNLSVFENIILPFYLHQHIGDAFGRAEYLIDILGLKDLKDMYPKHLSGGEVRRVLIARALMNNPSILIADEPTSDLDIQNTKEVMEIFKDLNEKNNTTIMIVTHEIDTLHYGKKVYTMIEGKLVEGKNI